MRQRLQPIGRHVTHDSAPDQRARAAELEGVNPRANTKGVGIDPCPRQPHAVRSATVGGRREARIAGVRPATVPMRMADAMPPVHASRGITMCQCFELAYTTVAMAPARTPTRPPMAASRIDSPR